MLRKILGTAAAFTLLSAFLVADEGSVARVDTTTREIEVQVGEQTFDVRAADVRLLDKDGNAANLEDFAAGAKVEVTLEDGKVTKIQLQ